MSSLLFVTITAFLLCIPHGSCWRRRRARPPPCPERSCEVGHWSSWSTCSKVCGYDGKQSRTRTKTVQEACGGGCYYDFTEQRSCNRHCMNGGTPADSYCNCREGFTGRCCEYDKSSNEKNNFEQKGYHDSNSGLTTSEKVGIGFGVFIGVGLVAVCICIVSNNCNNNICCCCNCCNS